MSEQVRQLEGELGVALFARAGRGLALTEAGRRFRPEAERVLADLDRARDAVVAIRELRGGTLSFGMFGTASPWHASTACPAGSRTSSSNITAPC